MQVGSLIKLHLLQYCFVVSTSYDITLFGQVVPDGFHVQRFPLCEERELVLHLESCLSR